MSIVINDKNIAEVYYGSTPIQKVYYGSQLVWQKDTFDGILFIANEFNIGFSLGYAVGTPTRNISDSGLELEGAANVRGAIETSNLYSLLKFSKIEVNITHPPISTRNRIFLFVSEISNIDYYNVGIYYQIPNTALGTNTFTVDFSSFTNSNQINFSNNYHIGIGTYGAFTSFTITVNSMKLLK